MSTLERLKLSNDRLLEICVEQGRKIVELQNKINRLEHGELARLNVWHWQSDGDNHLESLTCMVLIDPADLRRLLWEQGGFRWNVLLRSRKQRSKNNNKQITMEKVDNTITRSSLFPRCVAKLWTK